MNAAPTPTANHIGVDESFWWHVARCQCQCQAKSGSTEMKCADTRVAVLPVADQKGCGERNIQPLHSYSIVGSWNYGTPFVFMKLKRDTWSPRVGLSDTCTSLYLVNGTTFFYNSFGVDFKGFFHPIHLIQ